MSSGAASAKASPSVTKQIVGVFFFICSLFFLTLALGIGALGGQHFVLSPASRLICFVGAIFCTLLGLLNFGVL